MRTRAHVILWRMRGTKLQARASALSASASITTAARSSPLLHTHISSHLHRLCPPTTSDVSIKIGYMERSDSSCDLTQRSISIKIEIEGFFSPARACESFQKGIFNATCRNHLTSAVCHLPTCWALYNVHSAGCVWISTFTSFPT